MQNYDNLNAKTQKYNGDNVSIISSSKLQVVPPLRRTVICYYYYRALEFSSSIILVFACSLSYKFADTIYAYQSSYFCVFVISYVFFFLISIIRHSSFALSHFMFGHFQVFVILSICQFVDSQR